MNDIRHIPSEINKLANNAHWQYIVNGIMRTVKLHTCVQGFSANFRCSASAKTKPNKPEMEPVTLYVDYVIERHEMARLMGPEVDKDEAALLRGIEELKQAAYNKFSLYLVDTDVIVSGVIEEARAKKAHTMKIRRLRCGFLDG